MREKTWQRSHLHAGSDGETDLWDKRAVQFWALQGRKYGLIIDLDNTQTIITDNVVVSRAMVLGVIPGSRIDEDTWRQRNPPSKLVQQLGFV